MPMLKGGSPNTVKKNISEFHTGPTYAHTAAKFGKKRANAQAIAAALSTARRYGKAEGGEVEIPEDDSLERAYDPNTGGLHLRITPKPEPRPEYTDADLRRLAPRLRQKQQDEGGRPAPTWMPPPQSTYWQATHGADTGPASLPRQEPAPETATSPLWEPPPLSRYHQAAQGVDTGPAPVDRAAAAKNPALWGRELSKFTIDPFLKVRDLAKSGEFQPGEPLSEEGAGALFDAAGTMAGGVRIGAAAFPKMVPKNSVGVFGANLGHKDDLLRGMDWDLFETEMKQLLSPSASHGPMTPMAQHKNSWIDSSNFEHLESSKGSNPGGVYRDPGTNDKWYLKQPPSVDHLKNEILANKLYQLAGVPVPELGHTTMQREGQFYPALASRMVKGSPLNKFPSGDLDEIIGLKEHFPIDAWLANWDAVGTGKDNIIVNPITMEATRIDAGGALNYRAQGTPKGKDFGNDVPELKTMLDPKKSPDAAQVFQGAHKADVGGEAAQRLAAIKPTDLAKVINEWGPGGLSEKMALYDKLMSRRKAIVDHYAAQAKAPTDFLPPPELETTGIAPAYIPPHQILGIIKNQSGTQIADSLLGFAQVGQIESALAAKLALPKVVKQNVNKILWGMKNTAKTPEESELLGSLFADKKFPKPPENVSKADTPKAIKDYDKEIAEYNQALEEQDNHQYELAQGQDFASKYPKDNPRAPGPDQIISYGDFNKLSENQIADRFNHQLTRVPDWRQWKPDYKSYSVPQLSKVQPGFAKLLGFNTDVTFYKGGEHHFSGHFMNPAKKASEPGFFLSDNEDIARAYANSSDSPIDRYVVRASKSGEIDWKKFTGLSDWHPTTMTKLLHQARKDGLDMIIIKNIEDVGGGKQDQYVLLNTNGTIRSVNAEFNPTKIGHGHSHWALPPAMAAGAVGYGAMQDEGQPMIKRASGGDVPMQMADTTKIPWASLDADSQQNLLSGAYVPQTNGELNKYDETLTEHGSVILPVNPFGPRDWQDKSFPTDIERYDLPDGRVILRKKPREPLMSWNKRAKGGSTPFHLRGYNESIGAPTSGSEPGVRHFTAPHTGMIHSPVPGRTDKISMNVRGGSYILPASIVSGIGQGNSMAGASILNKFFKMSPYGAAAGNIGTPRVNYGKTMNMRLPAVKQPKFAEGGQEEGPGENVPIVAAGAEFIVPPHVVQRLGGGNMKQGHAILDEFVSHMRQKTINDMKNEKPPKK